MIDIFDELFFDKTKPYTDIDLDDGSFIRIFDSSASDEDYVWHRDKEDRTIIVLSCGNGWMFQFDNEMPFPLNSNDELFVPKMIYHRLIPGSETLALHIKQGE